MHRMSERIIRKHLKQQNAHRVWLFQTSSFSQNEDEKSIPFTSHEAPPDTVIFNDPQYDETVMDFGGGGEDGATITQVDEAGITHTIVLSPDMLRCIFNRGLAWTTANVNT